MGRRANWGKRFEKVDVKVEWSLVSRFGRGLG